jgi:hypothetical protein
MDVDCRDCGGEGASGWIEPDVELFREFAGPALARLSAAPDATGNVAEKTTEDPAEDAGPAGRGEDIDGRWGDGPAPALYEAPACREAG